MRARCGTDEVGRLPFEDYVAEVTAKPDSQWNEDQWHVVSEFYLNNVDPAFREDHRSADRASWMRKLDKLSEGGDLTLVSWEKPSLAYADVLTRGVYTARTERVEANTPHYLPPLPEDEPHNRLALAQVDGEPRESADRASDREPHVVRAVRHGPRGDDRRLRHHGPAAVESGTAGLAGGGVSRERVEHQAHVQADGDVGGVPAERRVDTCSNWRRIRAICCCRMGRASAWMRRCCAISRCSRAGCW